MNKIFLIGHLGKDVELRQTQSGDAVANFSLAVKNNNDTLWMYVVAWKKTAENAAKYLHKGSKAAVVGYLTEEKYTDREGVERKTMKVNATEIEFLDPKRDDDAPRQNAPQQQETKRSRQSHEFPTNDGSSRPINAPRESAPSYDDIPF